MTEPVDEKIRRAREAWELGARVMVPKPVRPVPEPRLGRAPLTRLGALR